MNLLDYPITDGFALSTKLRCGLTFRDIATQEYELLRRSTAMRNKMWLSPKDSTVLVQAYDSFEYQIYMKPGSAIWGYTFAADTGGEDGGTTSFQVRDACNDIPLFSEVVTRQLIDPPYPQQYLAKLLIVGPPGLLNVEICNTFNEAIPAQLILFGGEPAL
jgi:hypothetical protein